MFHVVNLCTISSASVLGLGGGGKGSDCVGVPTDRLPNDNMSFVFPLTVIMPILHSFHCNKLHGAANSLVGCL